MHIVICTASGKRDGRLYIKLASIKFCPNIAGLGEYEIFIMSIRVRLYCLSLFESARHQT